jgi:hypothetical protein
LVIETERERRLLYHVEYSYKIKDLVNSGINHGSCKIFSKDKDGIELILARRYSYITVVSIDKIERLVGEC